MSHRPKRAQVPREMLARIANIVRGIVEEVGGQGEAAALLGMSQAQVSYVLNETYGYVGLTTLLRLRKYTGRTIDDLLGLGAPPVVAPRRRVPGQLALGESHAPVVTPASAARDLNTPDQSSVPSTCTDPQYCSTAAQPELNGRSFQQG